MGHRDAHPPPLPPDPNSDWRVTEVEDVGSTNDAVADWPAWTALRAGRQTGGRGRHRRVWVSDPGGLWLSAVVPIGPPDQGWSALPLAAGLAVCETLSACGVPSLHLRWPNDVLAGPRKLAGLLVDCFRPGLAVVGIGLNVHNRPDRIDPTLAESVVRLADLVDDPPALSDLTLRLLAALREVIGAMEREGFARLATRLDRWWKTGLEVEIEIDSARWNGFFEGVDAEGRIRVRTAGGSTRVFGAHQVTRLRESQGFHTHDQGT